MGETAKGAPGIMCGMDWLKKLENWLLSSSALSRSVVAFLKQGWGLRTPLCSAVSQPFQVNNNIMQPNAHLAEEGHRTGHRRRSKNGRGTSEDPTKDEAWEG